MELKGSPVEWDEQGQTPIPAVLIDLTGGEAQILADALENIAAGGSAGGRVDDGENMINIYLVP